MFTFQNKSTSRLEAIPTPLPVGSTLKGTEQKDGKTIHLVESFETLTVPTTLDDLREILNRDKETVTLTLGDKDVTVPVSVACYIRDQKLQSQQAMQAALRTDNKSSSRDITLAWWMGRDPNNVADVMRRLQVNSTGGQLARKAHNAWLDGLYTEHKEAIDTYAKSAK
jgi:hypothetical protein